jgi:hypothetical protein
MSRASVRALLRFDVLRPQDEQIFVRLDSHGKFKPRRNEVRAANLRHLRFD